MKRFDPDEALYWIEKEHVSRIGIVPTMLYQLLETPAFDAA